MASFTAEIRMEQIGLISFGALLGAILSIGVTLLAEKLRENALRKKLKELFGFEIGVNLVLAEQDSYASHIFLSDIYSNYLQNLHLIERSAREALLLHYRWVQEYEGLKTLHQSGGVVDRKHFEGAVADIKDAGNKAIEELSNS